MRALLLATLACPLAEAASWSEAMELMMGDLGGFRVLEAVWNQPYQQSKIVQGFKRTMRVKQRASKATLRRPGGSRVHKDRKDNDLAECEAKLAAAQESLTAAEEDLAECQEQRKREYWQGYGDCEEDVVDPVVVAANEAVHANMDKVNQWVEGKFYRNLQGDPHYFWTTKDGTRKRTDYHRNTVVVCEHPYFKHIDMVMFIRVCDSARKLCGDDAPSVSYADSILYANISTGLFHHSVLSTPGENVDVCKPPPAEATWTRAPPADFDIGPYERAKGPAEGESGVIMTDEDEGMFFLPSGAASVVWHMVRDSEAVWKSRPISPEGVAVHNIMRVHHRKSKDLALWTTILHRGAVIGMAVGKGKK